MTRQVGNEIDEFVTEALRNNLLGLPLDLAAINIARGRDTGIPSLNAARREFYAMTGDSQLKPYTSWADFVQHLKHAESVVNFIAAYGTHADHHRRDDAGGQARGGRGHRARRRWRDPPAPARLPVQHGPPGVPQQHRRLRRRRRRDHHRRRRHRLLDRRPRREADAVRRPARLDLQLRVRDAARGRCRTATASTTWPALAGLNFLTELENNSFAKL